jgi:putative ABC transport system permease protein
MSILIFDHLRGAKQSLRANRVRTFLTIVGIAIGVASMTIILSLGAGVTKVISNQVSSLDGNIAIVRPGVQPKKTSDLSNPLAQQAFGTSTINEKDAMDIRALPDVKAAAPLMLLTGTVGAQEGVVRQDTIVASTPDLPATMSLPVEVGQFFDDTTDSHTAVIGNQLSIDVFGTDQSIGKIMRIRGQQFRIIGVLKRLNDPINFTTVDFDRSVVISLDAAKDFHQGSAQIQQINVRAVSAAALPGVVSAIDKKLVDNHLGEKDTTILSGRDIARPTSQFFVGITTVMTIIAGISLVVGGVGIMNIMLVSVAERTREIGLRKAVGASNVNIIGQFLIEALLMSALGGIVGYIAGYLVSFVISAFLTFDPAFTWQVALAAIGTSVVTGAVFGLYPAIRASRKHPIESLRQYH